MNVLEQIGDDYAKFLAMVVWKYAPDKLATITLEDLQQFAKLQTGSNPMVFMAHGHKESIDFRVLRKDAAQRMAEHHEKTQGSGRG